MDERTILEAEVTVFGRPRLDPGIWNELLKGGNDVAVKFGVRRCTGPTDGVGDTGFLYPGDGPDEGLAPPTTRNNGEAVVGSDALATTLGAGQIWRDGKLNSTLPTDSVPSSLEERFLLGIVEEPIWW